MTYTYISSTVLNLPHAKCILAMIFITSSSITYIYLKHTCLANLYIMFSYFDILTIYIDDRKIYIRTFPHENNEITYACIFDNTLLQTPSSTPTPKD